MVLNVSANRIIFLRFALNFKWEVIILVDFTNSTAERNGLYVKYYGFYAAITSLLRDQCTHYYASSYPLVFFQFRDQAWAKAEAKRATAQRESHEVDVVGGSCLINISYLQLAYKGMVFTFRLTLATIDVTRVRSG